MAHYRASYLLPRLVISGRCYSILQRATIGPHNLPDFYRTYRLPADPFFPLFLAAKRGYLEERARIKEEGHRYIISAMRSLPPAVLRNIKYLGFLERHYNTRGRSPVWQKHLFPSSKKKADIYKRQTTRSWFAVYRRHLLQLVERYRNLPATTADRVYACFVLELPLELIPPARPTPADVARAYRRLSLLHHPDRGGDPDLFIELKRARDSLAARTGVAR